jgi:hypothetical protein
MDFKFPVGKSEKHEVGFHFNQFWGNISITVDGKVAKRDLLVLSFSLSKKYKLTVGEEEKREIVIEKVRKLFFAGLRPSKYNVFIDGRLCYEFEGC